MNTKKRKKKNVYKAISIATCLTLWLCPIFQRLPCGPLTREPASIASGGKQDDPFYSQTGTCLTHI